MNDLQQHSPGDDSIEEWIERAGDYVRPSDELRPRVLEKVRQQTQQRKQTGPMLGMIGLGLAATLSFVWVGQSLQSMAPLPRMSSEEVEHRAVMRSSMTNQSLDWALMEIMEAQRPNSTSSFRFATGEAEKTR